MSDYKLNISVWNSLTSELSRLPHALLLAGPPGIGKRALAEALAARLLCEAPRSPGEPACGECASCLMLSHGQHPDHRILQPDAAGEDEADGSAPEGEKKKASQQIRISQIREIEDFFHIGGHRGGARVCLIDPAEAMNVFTANALLKILEEPSASFYFILVSHRWRRLLPTLLSRTRRVMFKHPEPARSQQWLDDHQLGQHGHWLPFFDHAPLALAAATQGGRLKSFDTLVKDLARPGDPLAQAARWESLVKSDNGLGMEDVVLSLQKWLHDLGQYTAGLEPRYFPRGTFQHLRQLPSLPMLTQAQRQVAQMRAWSRHPLNPRLFLEDLCTKAYRPLNP